MAAAAAAAVAQRQCRAVPRDHKSMQRLQIACNQPAGPQTFQERRLLLKRAVGRAAAPTARHLVAVAASSILRCAGGAGVPLHAAARLLGGRVPLVHLPVRHRGLQRDRGWITGAGRAAGLGSASAALGSGAQELATPRRKPDPVIRSRVRQGNRGACLKS